MRPEKEKVIKELQSIKNIGPAMAEKLYHIGVRSSAEVLRGDPESLFERLKEQYGQGLDRCVLYVLRGAKADRPWPQCSDKRISARRQRKGGY